MNQHPQSIHFNSNINRYVQASPHNLHAPLIKDTPQYYLDQIYDTLQKALDQYTRIFVIRIQLKYPYLLVKPEDELTNALVQRFTTLLEERIKYHMKKVGEPHQQVDDIAVRYSWAEDRCKEGGPRYHLLLLLNANAFRMLGYSNRGLECMRGRLVSVWADTLGLAAIRCSGLVHVSKRAIASVDSARLSAEMHHISWSCQFLSRVAAKRHGYGIRSFGCSDK